MPEQQQQSIIVHERVAFGEKVSEARRSGAGSHRSGTRTEQGQELPEQQQQSIIVHERVAFGEKVSEAARRSGAGSHRIGTLTEHVQELVKASKVRLGRSAVRLTSGDLNPNSGSNGD